MIAQYCACNIDIKVDIPRELISTVIVTMEKGAEKINKTEYTKPEDKEDVIRVALTGDDMSEFSGNGTAEIQMRGLLVNGKEYRSKIERIPIERVLYRHVLGGTDCIDVDVKIEDIEVIKGKDGHSPYIGQNGNWFEYDDDEEEYIDSGIYAIIPTKVSQLQNDSSYATEQYVNNHHDNTKQNELTQDDKQAIADLKDISGKVDKVSGKSLLADSEITRLASLHNYDDAEVRGKIAEVEAIAKGRATGYVFDTKADMEMWIVTHSQQLVVGDNLYIKEKDIPDYWWDGTQAQELEVQKVDLTEYRKSSAQDIIDRNKVDKVDGKGLSTNDYTTAEKTKLQGIEEGANKYVLPSDVPHDADYHHTDNNYTSEEKQSVAEIDNIKESVGNCAKGEGLTFLVENGILAVEYDDVEVEG